MRAIVFLLVLFQAYCLNASEDSACLNESQYQVDWFLLIVRNDGFPKLTEMNNEIDEISNRIESQIVKSQTPEFFSGQSIEEQRQYLSNIFLQIKELKYLRAQQDFMVNDLLALYSKGLDSIRAQYGSDIRINSHPERKSICPVIDITDELMTKIKTVEKANKRL